ncbi:MULTISPECIES: dihydrolipoyl dehydrogenase [unclassified Guyparkeria]|uniref:dihydrolipoyl dehydrogenase n=1 Tax=unclassified Guyparkeria TaxID=2626246 RepID=UPI00073388BA|nr:MULTISPECIES: dihydrolipoyl dehydrogenase [unclassified Guyparkeria]KTG17783.1 dihydrolipoamide dehydrogenase [Guyparkeria sp. XI15]OAE89494.1 dihydrolipoamide dehydrogenase [Guyparkeria sp. WRN-7]
MTIETINLPDIGNADEVEIIEVLVQAGDTVEAEDSMLTLETDKATMEIPAPASGTITEMLVGVGDKVSTGKPIAKYEPAAAGDGGDDEADTPTEEASGATSESSSPAPAAAAATDEKADVECDVCVLGSGPGGYTAAFRAADLGKKVVLIERYPVIGGVCLNVGCIPSKALLHVSEVLNETRSMSDHGVTFAEPEIDLDKLRGFKDSTIKKLTGGLEALAKQRKVQIVRGYGRFVDPHHVKVVDDEGNETLVRFDNAIVAAGSQPVKLPFIPHDDPRVMDSTDALELEEVPGKMLVIGGGIIGLEMAQVYHSLGAEISIVELADTIIPGADKDLTRPLLKILKKRYEDIFLGAKVTNVEAKKDGLHVTFEGKKTPETAVFDRILVAVGRSPNGKKIDAENAGVSVDDRGFIAVDERQRTNVEHIHAIGDVVGQPMLAHKAVHEGKVAAEVICGLPSAFTPMGIPSVAYTDPEVAWAGKTEDELKAEGVDYEKGAFPWAASGRSLSLGRDEGLTKALFCKETHRLLGAGIVGPNAGELVAEAMLAIEMGADMADIGLTIHPHPTLSETLGFAAEMAEGTITDLLPPKKR